MEHSSQIACRGPILAGEVPLALVSPLLERAGFAHAFFTRVGGVSLPPWDTLNFGATGDDPAALRENLARAARFPWSAFELDDRSRRRAIFSRP